MNNFLKRNINLSNISLSPNKFENLFSIFMFAGVGIFILSLIFAGFWRWKLLFFIGTQDKFMDFFNSIIWSYPPQTAYNNTYLMYPPLMSTLYAILASFVPIEFFQTGWGHLLRKSDIGAKIFIGYSAVTLSIFFLLLMELKKGPLLKKLLFCILIFLSFPFLHWIERGNSILIAVSLSMFFVLCHNNAKYWLRQIAIFALAIAVCIKIYPATLGILLLRDKRFKDIILLGVYTLILFFIPFLWFGGLETFTLYINNIRHNSNNTLYFGCGYIVNLQNTLRMIVYALTDKDYQLLNRIFQIIPYFALITGAISAYFIKEKWKSICLACLLMILVPSISYIYVLLFLIIPLIMFLDYNSGKNIKDIIYLMLFALIFMLNIPAEAPIFRPRGYPVLIDNFCARISVLIMFIMLCYEGIKQIFLLVKEHK